jgi:hypothetical protein
VTKSTIHENEVDSSAPSHWTTRERDAFESLASDLRLSPTELHRRIEDRFNHFRSTSDCLTIDEIERFAIDGTLRPASKAHLADCHSCQEMIRVLRGAPETQRRVSQTAQAMAAQRQLVVGLGIVGFALTVVAGLSMIGWRRLMSWLPGSQSFR